MTAVIKAQEGLAPRMAGLLQIYSFVAAHIGPETCTKHYSG